MNFTLNPIDVTIIIVSLAVTLAVGLWAGHGQAKTAEAIS